MSGSTEYMLANQNITTGSIYVRISPDDGQLLHAESVNENYTQIAIDTEILTSGLNQVCLFSAEGVLLQSNQIIKN